MAEEHEHKKKPKKKHLEEVRTKQAEDGTYVHHHTYKAHKDDAHAEPERQNVATSQTPDEAGEHVAEQFGMNQAPPAEGAPAGGGAPGGDAEAGGGGGGAPEEMMG